MSERRKDFMVFHYDPKKKFFLVNLRIEDRPGALGNLADILGVRGINIMEGYFGTILSDGRSNVSFYCQASNPKMDKEWLKEFLESSVYVSDVVVKESVEGFLADSLNFPVTWNTGERAIVMRTGNLQSLIDAARAAGGGGGDDLVYQAGFRWGKEGWKDLFITVKPRSKEAISELLQVYAAVGWARMEVRDLDPSRRRAKVRVSDCFECEGVTSEKTCGNFIRGHVAGALSNYFGSDVKGVETKCVSKGDSYCEIELSP